VTRHKVTSKLRELVITRGDGAEILEPAVGALDEISAFVALGIEREAALAVYGPYSAATRSKNTGASIDFEVGVHRFRARGLRPRPGMTDLFGSSSLGSGPVSAGRVSKEAELVQHDDAAPFGPLR
jgi:hypothetical protein